MGKRRIYWGKWKLYESIFPVTDKDILRIRRYGVIAARLFCALTISLTLLGFWQVSRAGERSWLFWVSLMLLLLFQVGWMFMFTKLIFYITGRQMDEIRRTGRLGMFFPAQIEETPKDENKSDQRDV